MGVVFPIVVYWITVNFSLGHCMVSNFIKKELKIRIGHWLPIITFCPVNGKPDFLFLYVTFNSWVELFEVRKAMYNRFMWRKMFMETVASELHDLFPNAIAIEVRLMTNRHVVIEHYKDL